MGLEIMLASGAMAEAAVVVFPAMLSYLVCYAAFRRHSVAVWGCIAAVLPRVPVILAAATGGTNLLGFAWLSHALGIVIYPIVLVVADILLLEIALVKIAKPVSFALPANIRTAIKAESLLGRLQEHHAVPRPVRVQWVYEAGIMAGIISMFFAIGIGLL